MNTATSNKKKYNAERLMTVLLAPVVSEKATFIADKHSQVMETLSYLTDVIGPRLTGSPGLKRANEWTRDQLTAMGCTNAHLEDWGEFGMGWRQLNTWVRMSAPDTAVFIAQALPWSASSHGPVNGAAIWMDAKEEKDFEKFMASLRARSYSSARCAT